jgi:hypothetical protein
MPCWILQLNPMRGHTEDIVQVAVAATKEELTAFVDGERVEPYMDVADSPFGLGVCTFNKIFRKGGPLEWFNPPDSTCGSFPAFLEAITLDDLRERFRESEQQYVLMIDRCVKVNGYTPL